MRTTRSHWSVVFVMGIMLMFAAGCPKPAEESAKKKGPKACPATLDAKAYTDGLICVCPKGADKGKVWGNAVFMTGSATCAAAIHAGAITKTKGGKVEIKYAAGCKSYKGTTKNGITSKFWSGNDSSFYFDGKGDGLCDK